MKTFLVSIVVALTAFALAYTVANASPAEAPKQGAYPADQINFENTAGVLVISINDKPIEVLFISTTGGAAAINYDKCGKIHYCHDLFNKLVQAHKVDELALVDGTQV
jgi:hypothetical protein